MVSAGIRQTAGAGAAGVPVGLVVGVAVAVLAAATGAIWYLLSRALQVILVFYRCILLFYYIMII